MGRSRLRTLLFSGGLDSTALAWIHRPDLLVFVDYGHVVADGERRAARAVADALRLPLRELHADFSSLGAGPLAGRDAVSEAAPELWPFRNQMLVTAAAMGTADARPRDIMIGTVEEDGIHRDGRWEFVTALSALLQAQGGPTLTAPAMTMPGAELLRASGLPVEVAAWTFSCHASVWACGQCRGCFKHAEGMRVVSASF